MIALYLLSTKLFTMAHLTDYLAPKAEFFEIEATVNLLLQFSGDADFEDFEEGETFKFIQISPILFLVTHT